MKIERIWHMPNRKTFEIKPIRELIQEEMTEGIWLDPFANDKKFATITNDLNHKFDTDYHMDAKVFLSMFDRNSISGALFDPLTHPDK